MTKSSKLVRPSYDYKESFLVACEEYSQDKASLDWREARTKEGDFETYLEERVSLAEGRGLLPEQVPMDTYWLVEGGEYIGTVKVRVRLTSAFERLGGHISYLIRPSKRRQGYGTKILELALEKLREAGVVTAILTTAKDNIGSRKIIEKFGGKITGEFFADGEDVVRYEISGLV